MLVTFLITKLYLSCLDVMACQTMLAGMKVSISGTQNSHAGKQAKRLGSYGVLTIAMTYSISRHSLPRRDINPLTRDSIMLDMLTKVDKDDTCARHCTLPEFKFISYNNQVLNCCKSLFLCGKPLFMGSSSPDRQSFRCFT